MEGWIKLYRQIAENKLWRIKPFGKGQAWVDILLNTSISDWSLECRGLSFPVKKGQCAMSKLTMSERWGWSTKKVSNFLKMLEKENQIEIHNSNVTTLITVKNWEIYQAKEQQKENQKKTRRKPEENNKEGKEGKEGKEKSIPPIFSDVQSYCQERGNIVDPQRWFDHYTANGWMVGKNKMKDWKAAIRTWEKNSQSNKNNFGDGPLQEYICT
jgi:hypothetical protein